MTSDGLKTTMGSIATTVKDHNRSNCALKQSSIHKEFEEGIAHQTCDAQFFAWNSKVSCREFALWFSDRNKNFTLNTRLNIIWCFSTRKSNKLRRFYRICFCINHPVCSYIRFQKKTRTLDFETIDSLLVDWKLTFLYFFLHGLFF